MGKEKNNSKDKFIYVHENMKHTKERKYVYNYKEIR
jgi:hypothetical protein